MFFNPEDRTKGSRKEHTFDDCKSNAAFCERGIGSVGPAEHPLRFALNCINLVNAGDESMVFIRVSN